MKKSMRWDGKYQAEEHIWGDRPSELAVIAVKYLGERDLDSRGLSLLDIGCGYGRDAIYLSSNLSCRILGIDISPKAIELAESAAADAKKAKVEFKCCGFADLKEGEYDIILISNLYQLLRKKERAALRSAIKKVLKPDGLLFLSTLSPRDPEHGLKKDEEKRYLHFCSRKELIEDFSFLSIKGLYEHEYREPRASGEAHHHISWILIGGRVK